MVLNETKFNLEHLNLHNYNAYKISDNYYIVQFLNIIRSGRLQNTLKSEIAFGYVRRYTYITCCECITYFRIIHDDLPQVAYGCKHILLL